jgi:hypothetical protein
MDLFRLEGPVGDAIERFMFNRAKRAAVKNSQCQPEMTS